MIEVIKQMPETPMILNCKSHGKYEARYIEHWRTGFIVTKACAKCVAENDARELEKKKKEDQEAHNERCRRRRLNAGISKRNLNKTFDSYIVKSESQNHALSTCRDFAGKVKSGGNPGNLFLIGNVGTGKTHLASSIIDFTVDTKRCEIVRVIELMRMLKETWSRDSENTEQGIINHYSNLDLLIIDEAGIQFGSDTEKMFMFDIINGRYENELPTVIISNLGLDELKQVLGEQAVDRLKEDGAMVLAFDWESSRGNI